MPFASRRAASLLSAVWRPAMTTPPTAKPAPCAAAGRMARAGGPGSASVDGRSIDEGFQRGEPAAVPRRVEPGCGALARHRAAQPGRLEAPAALEVVQQRGLHVAMQAIDVLHARRDE